MVNFKVCVFLLLPFLGFPNITYGIVTIHHNKPDDVVEYITELPALNITLTPSERLKRLLPYENFYSSQRINQPASQQQFVSEGQRYQFGPTLKKNTLNQQNKRVPEPPHEVLYQQKKYTPFLESNAIPGPFTPMVNPESQQPKAQIQLVQIPAPEKVPNYSAIYEKLSQLKYLQRRPVYVQSYRAPQRYNSQTSKPQVKFIPVSNYDTQTIQPSKTVVETYTATNIDIPSPPPEEQYNQQEHYQQIPTPIKMYENEENKQYQNVRKPYPQRVIIQVPQHYNENRNIIRKPIIILQKKPTVNDQPKTYQYQGETIPVSKPIIYVPSKQTYRPKIVFVTENAVQKYTPVIKYTQTSRYPQIIQQKVVPIPYQQIPKYEEMPKYEPPKYTQMHVDYEDSGPNEEPPAANYENIQKYEEPKYSPQPHYNQYPSENYEQYTPVTDSPRITTESSNNLAIILKQLQDTNTLPQTLTPENIDNSIKTLVKILGNLRKQQKLSKPIVVSDDNADYSEENDSEQPDGQYITQSFPLDSPEGGTPGKPGIDYPALSSIPQTRFNCKTQRYKGFFGDPDTNCQVWHYCDLNGGQASFLCPNGTIFSQVALTCDWWYNVKCATTAQLYVLNERLYKYIIPLTPKFPEDYSGPLVDKYLALKFQEMEDKMKKEKKGKQEDDSKEKETEELQDIEEEEEITQKDSNETNDNEKINTLQSIESGDKK